MVALDLLRAFNESRQGRDVAPDHYRLSRSSGPDHPHARCFAIQWVAHRFRQDGTVSTDHEDFAQTVLKCLVPLVLKIPRVEPSDTAFPIIGDCQARDFRIQRKIIRHNSHSIKSSSTSLLDSCCGVGSLTSSAKRSRRSLCASSRSIVTM